MAGCSAGVCGVGAVDSYGCTWSDVANMDPQGDELDRLCDKHPAPPEWQKEWMQTSKCNNEQIMATGGGDT